MSLRPLSERLVFKCLLKHGRTVVGEVFRRTIDHPGAWTRASLGGKDRLAMPLGAQELDAIDDLLARTRHLPAQSVSRDNFDHPALNRFLAGILAELQRGRGAVIITGVTPERYSAEDFERIWFGFGTHWGTAVVQSALGDRLGRVRFTPVGPDNPTNRAYRGNEELHLHTDTNEIVGLMCVQQATEGGVTRLASSLAVHNEILRTRPDLLPPLYEGYYQAAREAANSAQPVTSYKIPVFCNEGGVVSCMYSREFMLRAGELLGGMPRPLKDALDLFNAIAEREDVRIDFVLEPGEMMVLNNFTVLHARTAFRDSPTQKRYLLRLWLDVPNGRPVAEAYHRKAEIYRATMARQQVRAQPHSTLTT
jgi:hypothetical protein